ncbi:hypothetical protein GS429_15100 [Natronorubrum sp. JWXQ-INN-674]|uniref:Uncharacterized protein n=1 Tax=Natronorubrum halalkaliphilum TaxID=2691917 RepID=A0A6B0VQK8_9EURY|nr:hypothetical protein [Natronorubrum halalkaliphilum]MXV63367.1 hypothetical protein [Natronorubrum halalkaliphilum]
METRWATVDGVHLQLPEECTVDELREELHKPADAVLIAVTGDLVSVVHEDDQSLTNMVAGCADTYYFKRPNESDRNDVLAAPEIDHALENPSAEETTFQRPGIDH